MVLHEPKTGKRGEMNALPLNALLDRTAQHILRSAMVTINISRTLMWMRSVLARL